MLADRIVILAARPGKIDTIVPVDIPRPRKRDLKTTAEFGELVMHVRRKLYAVEDLEGAA
jgi:NitT/TauT family transport system ATP-binding protein